MFKRITKIVKSKISSDKKDDGQVPEGKQYTFMLTKDGIAKSVTVTAVNHIKAEEELKKEYPDYKVQFLWEWR